MDNKSEKCDFCGWDNERPSLLKIALLLAVLEKRGKWLKNDNKQSRNA